MAPEAGNGLTWAFLQPAMAAAARMATAAAASIQLVGHFFGQTITERSPLLPVEQNLAAGGAAFSDAGDVDGGVLLEGAGVLAGAAADTAAGINAWLLERLDGAG